MTTGFILEKKSLEIKKWRKNCSNALGFQNSGPFKHRLYVNDVWPLKGVLYSILGLLHYSSLLKHSQMSTYTKCPLILEQLDLLLLNQSIKRKFSHFLCLTISDILKSWIYIHFCLDDTYTHIWRVLWENHPLRGWKIRWFYHIDKSPR